MKQICVIGVGYVGLVTAACFADLGNRVVALDVDDKRVENLKHCVDVTGEVAAASLCASAPRRALKARPFADVQVTSAPPSGGAGGTPAFQSMRDF